jgi:hypothetical protein
VQVEDIVELGGVRVTVWIFARVGTCEGQSRVHLREEEGAVGADPTISFWGSARGVVGEWAGTYPLLSRHTFRSASFVISHAAMVAECGEPARAGRY